MRALHLIDPAGPGGGACTLRLLAESTRGVAGVAHELLLIGTREQAALAQRCGAAVTWRLSAPLNHPLLAIPSFRAALASMEASRGGCDVIHCWTPRTALLALLAGGKRRRLATVTVGPTEAVTRMLLGPLSRRRHLRILAASDGVTDEYEAIGVAPTQLGTLQPGVDDAQIEPGAGARPGPGARGSLRRQWSVGNSTFVIAVLSDPPEAVDAVRVARIGSVMASIGRDVRLLIHPRAANWPNANRWVRGIRLCDGVARGGRHGPIMIAEPALGEPWRVTAGADAALVLRAAGPGRRGESVLPALWAMAGGLPVVAEAGTEAARRIDDARTGLVARWPDVMSAADCLARLIDDRELGRQLGVAAARRVEQGHDAASFCQGVRQAYG